MRRTSRPEAATTTVERDGRWHPGPPGARARAAASIGTFDWNVWTDEMVSDGIETVRGLPPGSFGGTFDAYLAGIHPDDRAHVEAAVRQGLASGTGISVEYRVVWPDGSLHWVEDNDRVIADGSGQVIHLAGTCRDVTAHHERDEAIRFQAHLLDVIGEAVVATDTGGRIRYWNRAAEALYGWTAGEVIGQRIVDVTGPQPPSAASREIIDVVTLGLPWSGEFSCRTRTGDRVLVNAAHSPIRDGAERIVGAISVSKDVAAQRAAERAIESSEKKYRTLANALPALVSLASLDGGTGFYNTRWYEYTGLPESEAAEAGWRRIMHPDDYGRIMRPWEHALAAGESIEIEARLRRHDGAYRWHLGRTVPVTDEDGRTAAIVITAIDIHDRLEAEHRAAQLNDMLARRVAELSTVLDIVPVGIGIAEDAGCSVIRANPAFARLLGVSPEDNASPSSPDAALPFRAMVEGVALAPEDLPMQRAAREGRPVVEEEIDVVRDDGSRSRLLEYATPMRDDTGAIIGAVGAFVDISERAAAERSLRFLARATSVLSSTLDYEDTLRQLARVVVPELADWCAVDVIGDDGGIRRLTLANADRARERDARDPGAASPIAREGSSLQARAIRSGQPLYFAEVTGEVIAASAGAERRAELLSMAGIVSLACVPLIARGHVLGAITFVTAESKRRFTEADFVLARDLANRAAVAMDNARLFREAQQRADELRVANQAKDEFLGLVSHELRTPITTIFGNAQVLRRSDGALDDASRRGAISDIEQEADRLHRIVENMLTLARVDAGREFITEPVLVQHLAARLARAHMLRFPQRSVRLDAPDTLHPALSEPAYLEQIVRNLLSNAEKYSPAGTPIDIVIRQSEGELSLTVADRGAGIDADEADDLFTAFYRSRRTSGQASGVGMGLAVCKRLVEAQSGRVWARPRNGGGSEIGFTLPLVMEVTS